MKVKREEKKESFLQIENKIRTVDIKSSFIILINFKQIDNISRLTEKILNKKLNICVINYIDSKFHTWNMISYISNINDRVYLNSDNHIQLCVLCILHN